MFLKHWITPVIVVVWAGTASAQTSAGAFWRSLIVPGWGQHYANGGGGRFVAAEASLWLGYLGLNRLADVRADRFHTQASEYAGARSRGKGRQFLDDLGFYESRLEHNQYALREDGPGAEIYATNADWEWRSVEARERYRDMRNESQLARRQALYATGMVVANHLISAIHAARSLTPQAVSAPSVEIGFAPKRGGFQWSLVRRF